MQCKVATISSMNFDSTVQNYGLVSRTYNDPVEVEHTCLYRFHLTLRISGSLDIFM